jgi:hypothetical protein
MLKLSKYVHKLSKYDRRSIRILKGVIKANKNPSQVAAAQRLYNKIIMENWRGQMRAMVVAQASKKEA